MALCAASTVLLSRDFLTAQFVIPLNRNLPLLYHALLVMLHSNKMPKCGYYGFIRV